MSDPRESKLPVWARDILAHERMISDFRCPTEADPEPLFVADMNGFTGGKPVPRETWLWRSANGYVGQSAKKVWICSAGYSHERQNEGGGSRIDGRYYATEREALVAAWWAEARTCANSMHRVAQVVRECKE
jgi:hypothetical protein